MTADTDHRDEGVLPVSPRVVMTLAVSAAVAVHALLLWLLAGAIALQMETKPEGEPVPNVQVMTRYVPPPPDLSQAGVGAHLVQLPRFRPRQINAIRWGYGTGDPALAIWRYLCNRDISLSDATDTACPSASFNDVDMAILEPLNRRGDSGAMLGADTVTMSLEEAGVAKGWIRPRRASGQSRLVSATDTRTVPSASELFEDMPELQHPVEGAAGYGN